MRAIVAVAVAVNDHDNDHLHVNDDRSGSMLVNDLGRLMLARRQ